VPRIVPCHLLHPRRDVPIDLLLDCRVRHAACRGCPKCQRRLRQLVRRRLERRAQPQPVDLSRQARRVASEADAQSTWPSTTAQPTTTPRSSSATASRRPAPHEWRLILQNTKHKFQNVRSGKCLTLSSDSQNENVTFVQKTCSSFATTQNFDFAQTGTGYYAIRNKWATHSKLRQSVCCCAATAWASASCARMPAALSTCVAKSCATCRSCPVVRPTLRLIPMCARS
jgi:hypothetical protein